MTDLAVHKLPYWESQPDAFDTVFLGSDRLPGLARFSAIKRGKKYDDKSAKGKNKGPLTLQGYKRAEFEIELEIHGEDEWAELQEWMPDLESNPQPGVSGPDTPVAWDISSPFTAARGIEAIVITDVAGPEWRDGFLYVTLSCVEFDKPKPVATGTGGAGGKLNVTIGAFADPNGNPIPDSRVAQRVRLAVKLVYDGDGNQTGEEPLKGPDDQDVYTWNLLATTAGTDGGAGFVKTGGQFDGIFILEDTPLRQAWEAAEGADKNINKDVTETPEASAGAGSNKKTPGKAAVPAPSKTDAGP